MRENMGLYRGKRAKNGSWVEGPLLFVEGEPAIFDINDPERSAVWSYGDARLWGALPVIPETVGQFTGMPDKKGKLIFEGDIVRIDDNVKKTFPQVEDGDVRFSRGCFFVGSYGDILRSLDVIADYRGVFRGEVIGNIHDNPELLKEE